MKKIKNQKSKIKNVSCLLAYLCIALCYQANLFAEAMPLAERDLAIEKTVTQYLKKDTLVSVVEDDTEFMQAEAFYLYSAGRLEESILLWKEILLLDEHNQTALDYLKSAQDKLNAAKKPKERIAEEERGIMSMRQKKLGPTQGHYSHTKLSHNELEPKYVLNENRYFDHSVSLIRNEQKYAIRTDRETTTIAENIRADSCFGDYKSIFSASWSYDHTTRDDLRFPRYLNFLVESDKWRMLVGDNSTYLSRYVLNGMNYRGMEFMFNTDEETYPIDRFKILYGGAKTYDTEEEAYYYPIEVFGLRNEVELNTRYKASANFGYQTYKDKITMVDSLFRPRKNLVMSLDQYYKLTDWWILRHEIGYSKIEDEISNETIRTEIPDTHGWAQFFTSNILRDKWQLFTAYEYSSKDFRSLTGEPRFFQDNVLSDRELFENTFVYTPTDLLLFELQYHSIKNNLTGQATVQTTKENLFKGAVRITPNNWMPNIGLKTSVLRAHSIPASTDMPDIRHVNDFGIELLKELYGVDWILGYTYEKSAEVLNNSFRNFYRNIYSIGGNRDIIPERLYLNMLYSFADLDIMLPDGDKVSSDYENKFDASVSSRLWGSSNLSLGYNYYNRRDYAGAFEDIDSHTGSCVFSWPYTREFSNKQKLTMTPYLSYYYTKNDEFTDARRSYFASRLDTDYYITPEHKFNFMAEYKEGVDKSTLNQEGDEVRVMGTFTSVYGF